MDASNLPVERGRFIVLVPECLVHNMELMNKIYQMAMREGREVFYLALVDGGAKMLSATRSVATLKALVGGGRISAGSRVVESAHWVPALSEIYRPGDEIICQAEQQVRSGFLRTIPASEFIRGRFQAPVRTIDGFYHPEQTQISDWLKRAVYWVGLLAIITAFFMLEIRLDQGVHGAARAVLLSVLLVATLGVGAIWNRISSQ